MVLTSSRTIRTSQNKRSIESHGGEGGTQVEVNPRKRKRSLSVPPSLHGSRPIHPTNERQPSTSPCSSSRRDPGPFVFADVLFLQYRGEIKQISRPEAKIYTLAVDQAPLRTSQESRYVYYTDCSIVRQCGAGSVVWRQALSGAWESKASPYPELTNDSGLVELFAIANSLAIAVDQVMEEKRVAFAAFCRGTSDFQAQPKHHVFVFTDSEDALDRLERQTSWYNEPATWEQVHRCIEYYLELERLGASVMLHRIPGHSGIPGNVKADYVARTLARHMAAALQRQIDSQGTQTDLFHPDERRGARDALLEEWRSKNLRKG